MNNDQINEFLKKYSSFEYSQVHNSENDKTSKKENSKKKWNSNFNNRFFYTNEKGFGCNDMPGGFQRINPMLFIVIGDILGDLMSGKLPFNVQNALGNWIQLVGQAIETYSSQQQYFQSGPGRYYSPKNLNITNSMCSTSTAYQTTPIDGNEQNSSNVENNDNIESNKIIENLCYVIKEMKDELDDVKIRINSIEKNDK